MIYKQLKGKSEFFKNINTLEHYTMNLTSTDTTLDKYKANEQAFQSDYKKDLDAYNTSKSAADSAYASYNTEYSSIDISGFQKRLDTVNTTISTINVQIGKITTSKNVTDAKTALDTLIATLAPIQTDAAEKKTTATSLQTRGENVNSLLQIAYVNAGKVIEDINEGNLLRGAFDKNYAQTIIKPKIDAAQTALSSINIQGKTDVENQIITSSKGKLDDSIKKLQAVLNTASTQLDHTTYNTQRDTISSQQKIVKQNQTTLSEYIGKLGGIIADIKAIQDTCTSYQTNLPKISTALTNMSDVITNYDALTQFNTDIKALQPTQ